MADAETTDAPKRRLFVKPAVVWGVLVFGGAATFLYLWHNPRWYARPRVPPGLRARRCSYSYPPRGEDRGEYTLDGGETVEVSVHLGSGAPKVGGWLFITVHFAGGYYPMWRRYAIAADSDEIELRDSEGSRFSIGRGFWQTYVEGCDYLMFEVSERQAFDRIRYNDPTYRLSLRMPFSVDGRRYVFTMPEIQPTAKAPKHDLRGDTPGYAIVIMLVTFGVAFFGLIAVVLLILAVAWTVKDVRQYQKERPGVGPDAPAP